MNLERYEQADKIFQSAVELATDQRAAFLDRACAGEPELRNEVESLLAYDKKAQDFIEAPVFDETADLLADDAAGTLVGETIGPFRLVGRLGAGGMGEVYLAEDTRLGRKVALKLLSRSLVGDSQSRKRFLREARLASALDHPNICTIHDIGEASGHLYIAMQYIEGKTLRQLIVDRPLDSASLLPISLQVADGLAAAHAHGIIHRDIKSSNIIITPRGQAKVLDFGLARPLEKETDREGELTLTGIVMGTPAYMSPEQARGAALDQRSDIFSFGVVLYEMATGRIPFRGKSKAEVMNAVINHSHLPAGELNPNVPPELAAVIDRALSKESNERYQSIGEMISALRCVASQIGIQAQSVSSFGALSETTAPYTPPRQTSATQSEHKLPARKIALAIGLALVGFAFAINFLRPRPAAISSKINTIAVLPFKPLLAHDRDEALELGMADTLIARLSNQKELKVRPISAVRRYTGVEQDAVAAGREQKVDAVLDGQIQKVGERIRVTARVVRVDDGALLWSSQFDEKLTDIFAVQDSISERVAGALAVKLAGEEKARLTKRDTENAQAYQLYLLGRFHLNRLTDDGAFKSLEYFQQAVEADPHFALAHAGIAETYNALGGFNTLRPRDVYPKARSAAEMALKEDELLAEAHAALAMVKLAYDWDWSGSEREFKRALEINPSDTEAHFQYSYFLAFMGRFDEAVSEMRRAKELDPVSLVKITGVGQVLFMARRYDEAIEQCRRALEMDPNLGFAHWLLGLAYMQKGMYESAIRALQKSIPLSGDSPDEPASLACAYALSGKTGEARKILEKLEQQAKRKYIAPSGIAEIYGALGEKGQAFALLDKAFDERDNMMVLLKVEPTFDPLRSDPRFTALCQRIGFP